MKELIETEGIYVIKGPMSRWDLQSCDTESGSGSGYIRRECGWMTNMRELAELLEDLDASTDEMRRSIHLEGNLAKLDSTHPPKLAQTVLKACKDVMRQEGVLSALDAFAAGPNPVQPLIDETPWEQYWDDVNGGWLKPELCRKARDEELEWVHRQKVWEKRNITECWEKNWGTADQSYVAGHEQG